MRYKFAPLVCVAFTLGLLACQRNGNPTVQRVSVAPSHVYTAKDGWSQSSWADGPGYRFVDGHRGYWFASGVEVQSDGSLALSKIDKAGQTLANDLNNDGHADLIIANSGNYEFIDSPFAQIRHQNEDHSMPDAQIYWGGPDGYDENRSTGIPGDRPSSLAAMDFNLDGYLDLAVAGGGEFHPPYVNSRLYWGSANGFDRENYVSLPTYASTGTAAGDLNKDGYPDVVFANLGDYNFPFPPSLIYWGSPDGITAKNRTAIETHGVGGLAIVDTNQDGWLDLVFSNSAGFPPIEELMDYGQNYPWPPSYIYPGGPGGFKNETRVEIPTKGATGVKAADLNKDGYVDLVFANAGSFALPPLPDTYVYWGGPQGYSAHRRTDLRTNGASAVSVADINKDSWLDLVLSVTGTYLYIGKPNFPPSFVYWGGPNGYTDARRLVLQTEGSQGNIITDTNNDQILDICFSQLGDFNRPYKPVKVFYGTGNSEEFFTPKKESNMPGQISYGAIVVGARDGGDHMSHGNRALPQYDNPNNFVMEGHLISAARYADSTPDWSTLQYKAEIPEGTRILVVFESSANGQDWIDETRFDLTNGEHSVALSEVKVKPRSILRYKVFLISSKQQLTPILRQFQLS